MLAAPTSASPGGNLLTDESKKPARRKGAAERRRRYSVAGDGLILALTEGMNEAADDAGDIEAGQRPASTGRRASLVAFSADTQVREPPLGRSSSLEHIVDSAGKTRHAPFSHRILVAALNLTVGVWGQCNAAGGLTERQPDAAHGPDGRRRGG